jgi:hypothetical protein
MSSDAENGEKKKATGTLQQFATLIQVLSVIVASALSVWSFNEARKKEAEARILEAKKYETQRVDEIRKQHIEAAKPFLEIRQQKYMEAIKVAGVLANPKDHTPQELKDAEKRFSELYWAELSLVEAKEVESSMVGMAKALGKYQDITEEQRAAIALAHALRDSLIKSWEVDEQHTGTVNQ